MCQCDRIVAGGQRASTQCRNRVNPENESYDLSAPDPLERIVALEMTVAHVEYELEQMHSVLLAVQADLKATRDQLSKLERRLIHASEPHEERDPRDERPPHY